MQNIHVIETTGWSRETGYTYEDHGYVEARDKMHAAEMWLREYHDGVGLFQLASSSEWGSLTVSHPDGGLFRALSFYEPSHPSYSALTDRELERMLAGARNARDAYAAGREPSVVMHRLSDLLREQKYRRVVRRMRAEEEDDGALLTG